MYQYISEAKREYVISKQLLHSETVIGAMARKAKHAQSKTDLLNKMNTTLKDANETLYWLILLKETDYISNEEFNQFIQM